MHFFKSTLFVALVWAGAATAQDLRAIYENSQRGEGMLPRMVLDAAYAGEDRMFYTRDPATSTITSQLSAALIARHPSESWNSADLSADIAATLTPDEIVNWYADQLYIGLECFGVRSGGYAYFGKPAEGLTLEEAALLVSLLKAPALFDPVKKPIAALSRRNFVLDEMVRTGAIADEKAKAAAKYPIALRKPVVPCEPSVYPDE